MGKPQYDFQLILDGAALLITDLSNEQGGPSVTNAAEQVIAELRAALGTLPRIILYRDTTGTWDRLVTSETGAFTGFSDVGATSVGEAIFAASRLVEK